MSDTDFDGALTKYNDALERHTTRLARVVIVLPRVMHSWKRLIAVIIKATAHIPPDLSLELGAELQRYTGVMEELEVALRGEIETDTEVISTSIAAIQARKDR